MPFFDQEDHTTTSRAEDSATYRQQLQDPAFAAAERQKVESRWYDIQNGLNGYPGKTWEDTFDNWLGKFIDYSPYIYAAAVGASAFLPGVGGAGAAGTAGAASGTAAAGTAAGVGGATATGAGLSGLGAIAAEAAIPQVIITGTAGGGAAAGIGGSALAAGAAGLGGLGAIMSNGSAAGGGATSAGAGEPPMQQVNVTAPRPTPDLGLGGLGGNLPINGAALSALPSVVQGAGSATGGDGGKGMMDYAKEAYNAVGGLQGIANGVMPWLAGNNDRIKAEQDAEWWNGQMNTLLGMYKPGTPEAEQMRQKMEAQDAATGRRSQYGVRAVNLATNLAEKRAGIMTSAGYQNMANAYRNRSSQDLNGLFAAAGNQSGAGSGTSQLISGIGGLVGKYLGGSAWGEAPNAQNITPRYT